MPRVKAVRASLCPSGNPSQSLPKNTVPMVKQLVHFAYNFVLDAYAFRLRLDNGVSAVVRLQFQPIYCHYCVSYALIDDSMIDWKLVCVMKTLNTIAVPSKTLLSIVKRSNLERTLLTVERLHMSSLLVDLNLKSTLFYTTRRSIN